MSLPDLYSVVSNILGLDSSESYRVSYPVTAGGGIGGGGREERWRGQKTFAKGQPGNGCIGSDGMKRLGAGGRVSGGWLRQGGSNAVGGKKGRVQCLRIHWTRPFHFRTEWVWAAVPRTGVYLISAWNVQRTGWAGRVRTQGTYFCWCCYWAGLFFSASLECRSLHVAFIISRNSLSDTLLARFWYFVPCVINFVPFPLATFQPPYFWLFGMLLMYILVAVQYRKLCYQSNRIFLWSKFYMKQEYDCTHTTAMFEKIPIRTTW